MRYLTLVIPMILICCSNSFADELNYKDAVVFERGIKKSCEENFSNTRLEKWQVNRLCDCISRGISSKITYSELESVLQSEEWPKSVLIKKNMATKKCLKELLPMWGFGKSN